jgi:hypothetical protein
MVSPEYISFDKYFAPLKHGPLEEASLFDDPQLQQTPKNYGAKKVDTPNCVNSFAPVLDLNQQPSYMIIKDLQK